MAVISINYDLYHEPSRAYEELFKAIRSFPAWCHALESSWLVVTDMKPKAVLDALKPYLHEKDKVVVTPLRLDAGWWSMGLSERVLDWLRNNLSTCGPTTHRRGFSANAS